MFWIHYENLIKIKIYDTVNKTSLKLYGKISLLPVKTKSLKKYVIFYKLYKKSNLLQLLH